MAASSSSGTTPSMYAPVMLDQKSEPISDQEQVERPVAAEEPARKKRRKQKTERVEVSPPFNFSLPPGYVPIMDDKLTKKLALGDETWFPMGKRLKGWVREVRRRANGKQFDKFYYHNESGKKCRTFLDVKRYVYLGFTAVDDNGDRPLAQWAVEQPNPEIEGDQSKSSSTVQVEDQTPHAPVAPIVGEAGPSATTIIINVDSD